ncbi:MAG: lysozyme family protein [Bacilli bacterium]
MKEIKTRETDNKEIKVLNKAKNINHYEKKQDISTKQNTSNKVENEKNYAVDKVSHRGKKTVNDSVSTSRKMIKMYKRHKRSKQRKIDKQNVLKKKAALEKKPVIYREKTKLLEQNKGRTYTKERNLIRTKTNLTHVHTTLPSDKIGKGYRSKMRNFSINKYKKILLNKTNLKFRSGIREVTNTLKTSFNVVRKTIIGINNLMTIGSAFILLLVITLFLGVFSIFSSDSGSNTSILPLSAEVMEHKETIEKYAKQYELEDYVELIQAVMMQESAGKGNDPMQSSECEYNTQYPKEPNGITDSDYSIEVGIHYLSDCLKLANVVNSYDMKNISLALQGYNYGKDYISWAIEYFGGYTRANAKVFSDDMKAKLQTDVYGDPSYVQHVLQYYHLMNASIVTIAKTQIGNVGGEVYWKWYGYDSRVEWCACFVSWCAEQSGQLEVTTPKFSAVRSGIAWYKKKNLWKDKNYNPSAGDLIFFDWEQDGTSDHVGIVEKNENGTVYTIEGNSNNECRQKQYKLNSKVIYGYGATIM